MNKSLYRNLYNYRRKGFTLIELIVVITIVLILGSVVVSNVFRFISRAQKANCVEIRHNLRTELQAEFLMNQTLPEDGDYKLGDEYSKYKCPSGGTYNATIENGMIQISCSVHDEEDSSSNSSGYQSVKVAGTDNEIYGPPLNAVLKTLYDSVVMDKLEKENTHISYVQFTNGKISAIKYWGSENDSKGNNNMTLTKEEKQEIDKLISATLEPTGYKIVTNNGASRIFFDWNGNIVSNSQGGIGGQNASASIAFSKNGGINGSGAATLHYSADGADWTK